MTPLPASPRLLHALVLCLASLAACGGGGGGNTDPPGDAEMPIAQPGTWTPSVALEACIVDHDFAPRPHAVHAELGDGRWIAGTTANADGIFVLHVPAHADVRIVLEGDPASALAVSTGSGNLSVGACLIDSAA